MCFPSRNVYIVRSLEELYAIPNFDTEDDEINAIISFLSEDFNQKVLTEDYYILSYDLLDDYEGLHEVIRDHIERLDIEKTDKTNQLTQVEAILPESPWKYFHKASGISSLIAAIITGLISIYIGEFLYLSILFSILTIFFSIKFFLELAKEKKERKYHYEFKESLEAYLGYVDMEINYLNGDVDIDDTIPGVPMSVFYGE